MPRKKSAAKKAREAAEAASLDKANHKDDLSKPLPIDIEDLKKELKEDEMANSQDDDDEDDEEEDDYGELLTEDVENGLNDVLKAIKTGDKRLFDSNVKFFNDDENEEKSLENKEKSKPIYLKDYHRQHLLDSTIEEEDKPVDYDEMPYALQQKEDKDILVKEIHKALNDDEDNSDSDDDFLIKKENATEEVNKVVEPVDLPDPEKEGGEKFLEAFMANHAWLPNKGKDVKMDNEDDAEFDDAADKFESAYNFRYEDPKSMEIISYARSQATMRREKMNSRKRDRLKKQEEKAEEKDEVNKEVKKKKQKKINLVMDRIKEIKEAVGGEISDEKIMKIFGDSLLKDDFDDAEWDAKMSQIFDDEYYAEEDQTMVKPEWDDGLIEFDEGNKDIESDEDKTEEKETENQEVEVDDDDETEKSLNSKKSKKKADKYNKKQEHNKTKDVAERLVDTKTLDILDEVEEERGRNKEKSKYTFKYREVSPESFGLTYNEIFQANDKDLNELIGLKKLAPYRPHDKASKDTRKIKKSKNLREWRKRTFGKENGISNDDNLVIEIPSIVFDNDKQSSRKRHKKSKGKK